MAAPSLHAPRLLDPALVERYERDGFVVVPGLLGDAELERFEAAVTEGVRRRTAGDERPLAEKSPYQQSFIQCMNLWEDRPDVRPLTFHPRLAQAAGELMGVGRVRVWHDQALYKQPGGRPTDAHQDHAYWPIRETNSITAWIPFEGATRASGSLAYLPGSHRLGLRRFINIFEGEPEDILARPELQGIEPVFPEVPKGSVAFHHGLTVHLAEGNSTDRERAVHTVIYFPDGSTRGKPHPHFAVDRAGIQVGERIDSDVTPIAWPRAAGDLPVPPDSEIELIEGISNPGAAPIRS